MPLRPHLQLRKVVYHRAVADAKGVGVTLLFFLAKMGFQKVFLLVLAVGCERVICEPAASQPTASIFPLGWLLLLYRILSLGTFISFAYDESLFIHSHCKGYIRTSCSIAPTQRHLCSIRSVGLACIAAFRWRILGTLLTPPVKPCKVYGGNLYQQINSDMCRPFYEKRKPRALPTLVEFQPYWMSCHKKNIFINKIWGQKIYFK